MNKKIVLVLLTALLALGGILAFFRLAAPTLRLSPAIPLPPTISGTVVEEKGPVLNAIVQVQGTRNQTTTVENGAFTLQGITGTNPITITAWAEGHYIGWTM